MAKALFSISDRVSMVLMWIVTLCAFEVTSCIDDMLTCASGSRATSSEGTRQMEEKQAAISWFCRLLPQCIIRSRLFRRIDSGYS